MHFLLQNILYDNFEVNFNIYKINCIQKILNKMNEFREQVFIQQLKKFTIEQSQQLQVSIIEFQRKMQKLLVSQMFYCNSNINSDQQCDQNKRKNQLESVDVKNLLSQMMKLQSNLKYPMALLVVFILSKNKQKGFSIFLGFYYEILNSLIVEVNKLQQQMKKSPNKKLNSEKRTKNQPINRYCIQNTVQFFMLLIQLANNEIHQIKESSIMKNLNKIKKYLFVQFQSVKKNQRGAHRENSQGAILKRDNQGGALKQSKVYKILTSILCLPKSTLSVSLLIRVLLKIQFCLSHGVQILSKISYKLVLKLQEYGSNIFSERNIIDLLKLVLCKVEKYQRESIIQCLFQDVEYQDSNQQNQRRQQTMDRQGIFFTQNRKGKLLQLVRTLSYKSDSMDQRGLKASYDYHLVCFIIKNLQKNSFFIATPKTVPTQSSLFLKQMVFFISANYLHPYQALGTQKQTIKFYNTIISALVNQNNTFILKICLNFIQNQAIANFSVHKLKSLFKLLTQIAKKLQKMETNVCKSNKSINQSTQNQNVYKNNKNLIYDLNNKKIYGDKCYYQIQINEQVQLAKLKISRIIKIIQELTQRFTDKETQIQFSNSKDSKLIIQKIKDTNSMIFNIKMKGSRFFPSFIPPAGRKSTGMNRKTNDTAYQDELRLIKFVIGKSQQYQILIRIYPAPKEQKTKKSRSSSQVVSNQQEENNYFRQILANQPSYTLDIIVCLDKKVIIQDQIKNIKKIASSYFQLNVIISCNKSPESKGSILIIKINDRSVWIPTKQKRNEITSLEFGFQIGPQKRQRTMEGLIKGLYMFSKQISQSVVSKYENSTATQMINYLMQVIGPQSITCRINEKSQQILEDLKKQDGFFFKKQLKYHSQDILKRRSTSFVQIFKQIGGLNSIFYILDRINKSYACHFGQKTQNFFIEIFKILKNISVHDKQNFLFKQVKNSYSYICHFLFLIFRRNQHLANQRNSYFVESLFKFLMFFSGHFTKDQSTRQYPSDEVFEMELTFLKEVLCSFQIWSQCSIQIQSFVFLTLQGFIKNLKYTFALFSIDLHAKILSSVTFFYSQQLNPLKNKFQQKILLLCEHLYDKMLAVFDPKNDLQNSYFLDMVPNIINQLGRQRSHSSSKQRSTSKGNNQARKTTKKQLVMLLDKYVHRDVNESLSLIYSLIIYHSKNVISKKQSGIVINLHQKVQSLTKTNVKASLSGLLLNQPSIPSNSAFSFLPSELKTCTNLLAYFVKNFVQKEQIFHKINNDWSYVFVIMTSLQQNLLESKHKSNLDRIMYQSPSCETTVLLRIYEVMFKIVQKRPAFYNYIVESLQKVIMFPRISYLQTLYVVTQVIHINKKFNFQIYDTVFFLLGKRLRQIENRSYQIHRFFNDESLQKYLYKMADAGLTYSREFQEWIAGMHRQIQKIENQNSIIHNKHQQIAFSQTLVNQIPYAEEYSETETPLSKQNDLKFRQKKELRNFFSQLQDILFQICYETGSLSSGNRQWIQSYFFKRFNQNHLQSIDVSHNINILRQRRINVNSNLKIAYYCYNYETVYFMIDLLVKLCLQQNPNQDLKLVSETHQSQKKQPQRIIFLQKTPKKLKIPKQSSPERPNIWAQQQLNQHIFVLINETQAHSFFLSNPNLSMQTIYKFYQTLRQIQNLKYSKFNVHSLSLISFIYSYMYGKSLEYFLVQYSHSEQNISGAEKPVQAIKRKKNTIYALEMLSNLYIRDQIDIDGFYNSLQSQNQFSNIGNKSNSTLIQPQQIKKIKQNFKKFLELWYINNNPIHKNNPHNQQKIRTPKKLNLEQKNLFGMIFFEKLKFICLDQKNDQQKINELFVFLSEQTKGPISKKVTSLFNRVIFTFKYVLQTKNTLTITQNPDLFNNNFMSNGCPKNPQHVLNQKQVEQYRFTLIQKFNRILQTQRKKSQKSQNYFKKIQKENQFWLQIQYKDHEKKDVIYELDEKQLGPFGFYKLNIKPSIQKVQPVQYPRKKMFASIKSSQSSVQNLGNQMQDNGQQSILLTKIRNFDLNLIDDGNLKERRNTLMEINTTNRVIQKLGANQDSDNDQFLCQLVTKRGVYAGKLIIKSDWIEFKYISHQELPNDFVYRLSTGKFHQINSLTQQQLKKFSNLRIYFKKCKLFTRRYILRHTAFQLFQKIDHQSYFFNLFQNSQRQKFISITRQKFQQCLQDRRQQFMKRQYSQQWKIGAISNFQYICLINKFSGRSTNDLAQYYVFPWVVANYDGKNGFNQVDEDFLNNKDNLRNLACPPGKLNEQKFMKLKTRLMELDLCDPCDRFLYGTMFSNPTVLYNFFIRLQPYIHLHWEHQGKRIDHADRLFSGIQQQFSSVLVASSDMKELSPQFYYWPQFLKNRSYIDLGLKQNKQQVDDVVLPVWAHSPQQFIFKMRYALQSYHVSEHLHQWIDLTFGYKIKYQNAQTNDNLYHFNSYQRTLDYFQQFATDQKQIRSLQVSISQFGQIPEALFDDPHPMKNLRHQFLTIDRFISVKYQKANSKNKMSQKVGFQTCKEGIFVWTNSSVQFKKSYINQNYSYDQERKVFSSNGHYTRLLSFQDHSWLTLNQGIIRVFIKKLLKYEKTIQAQCIDIIGNYYIYSKKSSIYMDFYDGLKNKLINKKILYGHKDQIIQISCSKSLDLIISVDLQGFVMIHQLSNLAFMRNFQLPLQKQWPINQVRSQKDKKDLLKIQIHQMGYFVFLLNQKKLVVVTFLGEIFLQHDIQIISQSKSKRQQEKITDMIIFRHDQSILLLSTNKGNIHQVDFIWIKRYNQTYPYKTFTKIQSNVLEYLFSQLPSSVKKSTSKELNYSSSKLQSNQINLHKPIYQIRIQKIPGDKISLYQIIVQYQDGEILCFYQEKYLGKQLKENQKLKQIGLFF